METYIAKILPEEYENLLNHADIQKAAEIITSGNLVGFPTETVYGLGASVFSEYAVSQVYQVKGRPQDNPFIVHISNFDMLESIVEEIPPLVSKLCEKFWPGPLTILFRKKPNVPDIVTAGLSTVAVRMPSHPIALALIEKSNVPIAAPSANLSGFPSPTSAEHVINDLNGKIPMILDGGACEVGVESTVIDLHQDPPLILRPGGVSYEELLPFLPDLKVYKKEQHDKNLIKNPPSPGMKYRHYSPKAKVILLEGGTENLEKILTKEYNYQVNRATKIGLIHTHSHVNLEKIIDITKENVIINLLETDSRFTLGEIVARGIFAALRDLDQEGVDVILVEAINEEERGLAVMNRLRKAASRIVKK